MACWAKGGHCNFTLPTWTSWIKSLSMESGSNTLALGVFATPGLPLLVSDGFLRISFFLYLFVSFCCVYLLHPFFVLPWESNGQVETPANTMRMPSKVHCQLPREPNSLLDGNVFEENCFGFILPPWNSHENCCTAHVMYQAQVPPRSSQLLLLRPMTSGTCPHLRKLKHGENLCAHCGCPGDIGNHWNLKYASWGLYIGLMPRSRHTNLVLLVSCANAFPSRNTWIHLVLNHQLLGDSQVP